MEARGTDVSRQVLLDPLRNEVGEAATEAPVCGIPVLRVPAGKIERAVRLLKEHEAYRFDQLIDLTCTDHLQLPAPRERFELVYQFLSFASGARLLLKAWVAAERPEVASATPLFKSADWLEREVFDQYGVRFHGHPNLKRILNHKDFVGHPLRRDYDIHKGQWLGEADDLMDELEMRRRCDPREGAGDRERMTLNLGPSHPAAHGTLRNLVELSGETILYCVPEIGYLHRGFEKSAEAHDYNGVVPYTDRLNYCSAIMNNIGFVKTIETYLGIEITERCKFVRVIMAELSRIMDHLVCNGANLVDLGALTNFWFLFNLREKIYNLLEAQTGARLTNSYTRVGGLWADVTDDFDPWVRKLLEEIPEHVDDTLKLVARNRIFLDRTVGVGVMPASEAISFGYTGPCLRASGVEWDLRKAAPYYHYDEFDFDVPVGEKGDVYDRIMVRFEEIRQSCRIIEQALDRMPGGPINIDDHRYTLPPKEEVYGSIEGMVAHFNLVMRGIQPPPGDMYDFTEAANGELGFYTVSDGSRLPYKCHVRAPCFPIYSSFPRLVEGGMIADAIAVLGSLNVIAGELDR
ncbi:MAG: NADH-quinone oxidoreductase subunit D [Candidatus Eisenbacteria bacterium]|nr:NADH-quinone oxidoreductase subunit D [Candidatus Eisenbacteria bacterium]